MKITKIGDKTNLIQLLLTHVKESGKILPGKVWITQEINNILQTNTMKPDFNKSTSKWQVESGFKKGNIQRFIITKVYGVASDNETAAICTTPDIINIMNILLSDDSLMVNDGSSKDRNKLYEIVCLDGESVKSPAFLDSWALTDTLSDILLYKEIDPLFFSESNSSIQGEVYF